MPVSKISRNKVHRIECYTKLDINKLKRYAAIQSNFKNSFETSKSSKYLTQTEEMDGAEGKSDCCVNKLTRVQFPSSHIKVSTAVEICTLYLGDRDGQISWACWSTSLFKRTSLGSETLS